MNEASIEYLCRLCLNKSYFYSNIYCGQSKDCDPLYETINYVFDLQISMDDGLPEYVCHQCLSMVHDFQRFKRNVQKATLELLRLKQKMSENSVGVKYANVSCKSFPEDPQDQINKSCIQSLIKEELDPGGEVNHFGAENSTGTLHKNPSYGCLPNEQNLSDNLNGNYGKLRSALEKVMGVKCGSLLNPPANVDACGAASSSFDLPLVPSNRKCYTCDKCRKGFRRKAELVKHIVTHSEERPYPCSICGRRFKRIDVRKVHQLRHVEAKSKRFSCEICGKQYALKDSLRKHTIIHTVPLSCPTCGKQFYQSATLKQHMRIHSGEKPFACQVCGKAFRKNSDLSQHMVSHSDERPFPCTHCHLRFKTKNCRNKHQLFHLKE